MRTVKAKLGDVLARACVRVLCTLTRVYCSLLEKEMEMSSLCVRKCVRVNVSK